MSGRRTVREPDSSSSGARSENRTLTLEDFDAAVDALAARLADREPARRPPAAVVVALAVQIGYLSDDDRADLRALLDDDDQARAAASVAADDDDELLRRLTGACELAAE